MTLVQLVGLNPLPLYLAAATLRPGRIILVHSDHTVEFACRLRAALRERLGLAEVETRRVGSAMKAQDVRAALGSLPDDVVLDYTGGTKVMAAQARVVVAELGLGPDRAWYLDERAGVLRRDDGIELDVERALDLDAVMALHGSKRAGSTKPVDGEPGAEEARAVAAWFLADPLARARRLGELKSGPRDVDCAAEGLAVGVDRLPSPKFSRKANDRWLDFLLKAGWHERWVADLVRSSTGEQTTRSLHLRGVEGVEHELDVVAVAGGRRLYVLSCTTDTTVKLCKSKAFEVALRARQLGGDLARSAVVCAPHHRGAPSHDQVQDTLAGTWGGGNPPRVFGIDHQRAWLRAGRADDLAQWMAA